MKTKNLDIVYCVKESVSNEELRYSLRSLENIPHRKVWIYGGKPEWVENVEWVHLKQDGDTKWDNASDLLKEACKNDKITKNFIWFNDDFFVMRKIEDLPLYCDRTLADRAGDFMRRAFWGYRSKYMLRLKDAEGILKENGKETRNCELHLPIVFNREKFLKLYELYPGFGAKRSLYGNTFGKDFVQTKDCKIYTNYENYRPEWIFLSTTDVSFRNGAVGKLIRGRFNKPCKYENGGYNG